MRVLDRTRRLAASVAAAGAAALLVAACGSGGAGSTVGNGSHATVSGTKVQGGTATLAWVAASPNFIFPLIPATNNDGYDQNLYQGLWPNLVYAGDGSQSIVNPKESLYSSLTYSDDNRDITIVLKPWKWSDGVPISSRDFLFTYDLLKVEYTDWINYISGTFPADVTKVSTPNSRTIVIDLDHSYNPAFYTDDVLANVPLMPQHAWDKTSVTGKVGNDDETTSGAKAVWAFLQKKGADEATFATNPLWKVVDGPWKLDKFVPSTGYYSWTRNDAYSGPDKPILSHYVAAQFTSDTSELDTLRAGSSLDAAPLYQNDIGQLGELKSEGYSVVNQPIPGVAEIVPNFWNSTVGPLVKQLYIRQAMEDLINRPQIVSKVYDNYADPGNGPVPLSSSQWVSPLEKSGGPYPYSPTTAITLLKAHGWKVVPNGTSTCQRPGSGASDCGAGIPAGKALSFQLLYSSGSTVFDQQNAAIQTTEEQAGIRIVLKTEPYNTISATTGTCNATSHPASTCGWQLQDFGYLPVQLYPSSDGFFSTGGANNYGGYSSPEMNKLIDATEYGSGTAPFFAYEDYAARQLPWLWLPDGSLLDLYKNDLGGFTPLNPFSGSINPQVWYHTKPS